MGQLSVGLTVIEVDDLLLVILFRGCKILVEADPDTAVKVEFSDPMWFDKILGFIIYPDIIGKRKG